MDNKMGLCCSTEPYIETQTFTPTENARRRVAVPPFYQFYNHLPPPMNVMAPIFEEDEHEDICTFTHNSAYSRLSDKLLYK